jgi:hypothetical protein
MKAQDFYSIIQLGVGIHAGTAFLQLSGEFGVAPLERRLNNIESWLQEEREEGHILERQEDNLKDIKTRIYIFKIQYNNVYRNHVIATFIVALILSTILGIISFFAESEISERMGILFLFLSIFPAIFIFASLWHRASPGLASVKAAIERLEVSILIPPD